MKFKNWFTLIGFSVSFGCQGINPGQPFAVTGKGRNATPDPLLGMRLPPQAVPTAASSAELASEMGDPLLRKPNDATPSSTDRAGQGKSTRSASGSDVSALPPRQPSGPYRPGLADTPAALAGSKTDDLIIERKPKPPANLPTTVIPAAVSIKPTGFGESFDDYASRLKAYKASWNGPFKRGDSYVVLVDYPLAKQANGALRRYEGMGSTPSAAMKSAVEQIMADQQ